ncbi:MAG: chromosomal replication initiator protein DnaA [Chloroflexota bacterium]|nr:chromosomal replication initiator protein DnaA [Chloroflexota bacterium]
MNHPSPRTVWEAALGRLELQVSRPSFATWLRDTSAVSFDDGRMVVATPSLFAARWLEQRMSSLVEATLTQIAGRPSTVRFQVAGTPASAEPRSVATPTSSGDCDDWPADPPASSGRGFALNPRYTLGSFVVGASNQLAYAAAVAVSTRPGAAYNPLFLYGGVGLGKTHLLHGIGNASASRGLSCLYVSSEQFTNDFITSLQTKRTREFREKYRSVDVLLMDDIQFLRGKETVQESFFHTFNDLHNSNRQIVLACDRPTSALSPIEDRIRSRLQWGLSADIQLPAQETRRAILELKAREIGVDVPTDVLNLLTDRFAGSVRDMEGALNRVAAYADLTGTAIDLALAHSALGELLALPPAPTPSPQAILSTVCGHYQVDLRAVVSKRRDRKVTLARQVAIYLLREQALMPLKSIGALVGNREHPSVRQAWAKIGRERDVDPSLDAELRSLSESLFAPREATPS